MKTKIQTPNPTRIQIFRNETFGEIRTLTNENGETYFIGSDVARALGYSNTRKALQDHVDNEDKGVTKRDTLGGVQQMTIINESGLYSLILSSKLPSAKAFKRWVTSEVLPQIRRTGGYIPTKDARTGRALTEEEILDSACEIVSRTLGLLNSPNEACLTATSVARSWGMDVRSFNNLLESMGIQYRKGGRWHLADSLEQHGLAEERYFFCFSLKGKPRMRHYLVWTPQGADFLNLVVRKMPTELNAKIKLTPNF